MKNYKNNLELLSKNHVYSHEMEHDACGVGLIASTEGKKSRAVVEHGIEALKAVWHRGAVDADGKTGDGAGIHLEIPKDFFIEKIQVTGHHHDNSEICVGMIFLPKNDYSSQENSKTIVESELTKNDFNIYGWRQVPVNPKVLGEKALQTMPEIIQVLFKSNDPNIINNRSQSKTANQRFNRVIQGSYELGSVMKIFTLAMALEEEKINLSNEFDVWKCINKSRKKFNTKNLFYFLLHNCPSSCHNVKKAELVMTLKFFYRDNKNPIKKKFSFFEGGHQLEKLEFALAVAQTKGDEEKSLLLREKIVKLGGNVEEPGT